jgi:hypothetical protein|tara:strand:- start:1059 stop:1331 length:273 start_codon:yes stop_codon:yes gene_type:complete
MIDTDKYEGHNMHPALLDVGEDYNNWDALQDMGFNDEARQLIAVAPLLLEEVKRLHNHIRRMRHWAEPKMHEVHHDAWRKLHDEIYEGDD